MSVVSNLFPPIMNTYMPAFIYNQSCRVYFSISQYNTLSTQGTNNSSTIDVNKVQVSVRRQVNNRSALNETLYPNEIKICSLSVDTDRASNDKYYITISNSDIKNGFNLNQYYKVQIRFTDTQATALPGQGGIASWLSQNLEHFSQWSSVTLIYGISNPNIKLSGYAETGTSTITNGTPIQGYYYFSQSTDKQRLKSYRIKIYKKSNNELIEDSGQLLINNYNNSKQLLYLPKYDFKKNIVYKLSIQVLTNNLYTWPTEKVYNFKIYNQILPQFDVSTELDQDIQNGCLRITFTSHYLDPQDQLRYTYDPDPENRVNGKTLYLTLTDSQGSFASATFVDDYEGLVLYNETNMDHDLSIGTKLEIKRCCNLNNFEIWEYIDTVTISQKNVKRLIWLDCTVQPGVWYKYHVIRYGSTGLKTSEVFFNQPKMVASEDIFLTGGGRQLRIRFDPQISGFNIKTSQALIETIGSKYPFIRKNSNISYQSFQLSGTISHFMDTELNLFKASKQQLYGEYKQLYDNYNEQHKIDSYYDFVYEKYFRKKVIEFLYDGNIKTFRSLTQGNILVRLMDISFTPNTSLGRMIYSFSCTVYQVADNTIDNYQFYDAKYTGVKTTIRQE